MRRMLFVTLALVAMGGFAAAKDSGGHVINDSDITTTLECTADRSEVALNGSDLKITITGKCTKIAVNGSDGKITIAEVDKLAVNGSDNVVDVDAAGKIAVTGADNKVTWKRGTGKAKKPKIAVLGTGNDVKRAK